MTSEKKMNENMLIGLDPWIAKDSVLLILGSFPSSKSLIEQQYYAHPRNHFWPILFNLFNKDFSDNIYVRKNLIKEKNIALWDVVKACRREGSSDTNIRTIIPNKLEDLADEYPNLSFVAFNGNNPFQYYNKLKINMPGMTLLPPLPSTSPANARLSLNQKTTLWSVIKDVLS